jgi:hypothetical protein
VGRGIAQSKKLAKHLASIQALKNLAPSLFEEWRGVRISTTNYRGTGVSLKEELDSQTREEPLGKEE